MPIEIGQSLFVASPILWPLISPSLLELGSLRNIVDVILQSNEIFSVTFATTNKRFEQVKDAKHHLIKMSPHWWFESNKEGSEGGKYGESDDNCL